MISMSIAKLITLCVLSCALGFVLACAWEGWNERRK